MRKLALAALLLMGAAPDPQSEDGQIMQPHSAWITRQKDRFENLCCHFARLTAVPELD
jgi:hypothetical protein